MHRIDVALAVDAYRDTGVVFARRTIDLGTAARDMSVMAAHGALGTALRRDLCSV